MALTKASVLSELQTNYANTGLAWSDILSAVKRALHILSSRANWPDLYRGDETDDRASLVADSDTIDHPNYFKTLDCIILNDGTYDYKPLIEIKFDKLKRNQAMGTSTSRPRRFAVRGNKWYLDQPCDDSYTAKLFFWRYHPTLTSSTEDSGDDTILFSDKFLPVISALATYEYAKEHKRTSYVKEWSGKSATELALILPAEDKKTSIAKYSEF